MSKKNTCFHHTAKLVAQGLRINPAIKKTMNVDQYCWFIRTLGWEAAWEDVTGMEPDVLENRNTILLLFADSIYRDEREGSRV